MSTPHRAEINRANSQHSTGPKPAVGKSQSSLNALRRGLPGQSLSYPPKTSKPISAICNLLDIMKM